MNQTNITGGKNNNKVTYPMNIAVLHRVSTGDGCRSQEVLLLYTMGSCGSQGLVLIAGAVDVVGMYPPVQWEGSREECEGRLSSAG